MKRILNDIPPAVWLTCLMTMILMMMTIIRIRARLLRVLLLVLAFLALCLYTILKLLVYNER